MRKRHAAIVGTATAALVMSGGAAASADTRSPAGTADHSVVDVMGTFKAPADAHRAFTYQPDIVPAGSHAHVRAISRDGHSRVVLTVLGLKPGHRFVAHVHVKPCGADPAAAGGHYQHVVGGPMDPENEVWFQFTPNKYGFARIVAEHDWTFDAERLPGSVVIHNLEAGPPPTTAACLSVPFAD